MDRNCNHFTNDLCQKLTGKAIPSWVNRLASAAETFKPLIGDVNDMQKKDNGPINIEADIKFELVRCLLEFSPFILPDQRV